MVRSISPPDRPRVAPSITIIFALAALYLAKDVFIPLALAALLAFLLTPAVKLFEGWTLPRVPAVVLVIVFAFSVIGSLGWVAANQLIEVLNELPSYRANIHKKFEAFHGPAKGSLAKATESVKELSKELSAPAPDHALPGPPSAQEPRPGSAPGSTTTEDHPLPVRVIEAPSTPLQYVASMLGPLLGPFGIAVMVLVFAVAMLIKREDLRNRLLRLIGQAQLNLATEAFDDATTRVSRYLRLQFLINATFGALIATGLYFIGLPSAILWRVLAGIFRFVPYLGAILGGSLPFVFALALFDNWDQPALCLALFAVAEPVVAYVVEPSLYGTHTGVSSLAILVAAAFWTTLWGPIGLILSTPLTVCLVVLGRHVPQLGFLHVMLGDEPVLTPASQFYQRLLAMDQREAEAVAVHFLKEHSLVELYDDVLIPALSMVEDDRHKMALDETREQFFQQSLTELIAAFADYGSEEGKNAGPGNQRIFPEGVSGPAVRPKTRLICLPASDKADEIATAMLAQVFESAGYITVFCPVHTQPKELLATISPERGDTLCISALPPFALMNARTTTKALREQFPELRILLGLWSYSGGGANADTRLEKAFNVEVVSTIRQALECVQAPEASLSLPLAQNT
jgi:predicted PurR-regulated permease PerM